MDFLFELITFVENESVVIKMSPFEMGAMLCVLLQVWLYGRLNILGPVIGVIGTAMWIFLASRSDPVMMGLIILNIILMLQNIWNFIKWSRNKKLADAATAQEHILKDADAA
ncbi:MAG: nicotinamide mononucleotide transporter [Alphaproteobacteria bacterium]|nr:nicotinamide mononucleotide transporter [Alphaproteobacteria bacterium]